MNPGYSHMSANETEFTITGDVKPKLNGELLVSWSLLMVLVIHVEKMLRTFHA